MKGEIKYYTIMIFVVITVAVLLGSGEKATAAYTVNETGNATITLTVASKTMIDITPQVLDYATQDPGTEVVNYTYDGRNLTQIQIENIGSTNLTNVWFNTTQPSARPFGTGDSSNYDAANFIAIKNSTMTSTQYAFVDRLEYNHSTDIAYLKLPADVKTQGRLRAGPKEYFWATTSDGSYCNGTDTETLNLATIAHNETDTGDIDLTDNSLTINNIAGTIEWGLVNEFTVGDTSYCAAVSADCSKVRFYRWNADAPGEGSCTLDLRYSTTTLYPGDSFGVDIRMYVPYGVAQGAVTTGTLTVLATSV